MLKEDEYSSPMAAALNSIQNTRKNNKNKNNKRRFSDEQIKSLETTFETETNLEPRKKMLLAKELGLQPRQVAIWFQNKRARWKSKQLEQEYNMLQSDFDSLATCFEALKKEKMALTLQLQKLKDSIEKPREGRECCSRNGLEENCNDGELEVKPSLSLERIENENENGVNVLSDEDSSMKTEYFGIEEEEEHSLLNMVEPADGSLTSSDNWGGFETDGLFDESSNSYQWWDFWS